MGQYHLIANLDKREYIHPHRFGDGLKLLEFGDSSGGTMTGLALLLAASNGRGGGDLHVDHPADAGAGELVGRWAGDRIAIVGDYFEPGDVPGMSVEDMEALWDGKSWHDISASVIAVMRLDVYLAQQLAERIDWATGEPVA